ncbi:Heteroproteinous nuclear ribonucleoprotein A1 [Coemansia sp. RSA 2322]|nr:Heteroproteinous nuclear ribonucleoprotein A1 [Coemansia sp. RSA 2322]
MDSTSKAVEDSLYDDANFSTGGGAYAYDPYQESGSQWLYNDGQQLQAPTDDVSAAELSVGAASASSNTGGVDSTPAGDSGPREEGKLFVGGLSWDTDEVRLRNYFSRFGNIVECSIMRDQLTGRPRGFGFVTYDSMSGVNAVLQEPSHTLDGKQIDPKHAVPRENQPAYNRSNYNNQQHNSGNMGGNVGGAGESYADPTQEMRSEKIFVGGLPPSVADADLNSTFSQFGAIAETKLMMDRETGRSRGYGFMLFETEDAAQQAVKAGNSVKGINIHGKRVDVKPAFHKKRAQMPGMGGMMGGGAPNGGYGMMGMMGMPGYGMMGMPGYGMMGMPGYGMVGANGNMDYSAAMQYGGYYGNMAGAYAGAQGDGTDPAAAAAAAAAAAGYYGIMGMPGSGVYPGSGNGADGSYPDPSTVDGGAGAPAGSGGKNSYSKSGGDQSGSGHGDQQGGSGYHKSHRQGDDRGRDGGRDGGYRSSSRRHGSSANDRPSASRGDRSRGDQGSYSNSRPRDDNRSSRGARAGRDRDGPVRGSHGSSSSRGHGYTPY